MSLKDKMVIYLGFNIKVFFLLEVSFPEQKFVVKKDYTHSIVLFKQHTHIHHIYNHNNKESRRQVIVWDNSAVMLFK